MSALINFSIDVAALPKEKFIAGKNGKVYVNLTMSVNDETRFGNNVALMDSRTKEERDAGVKPNYLGNGKVVFINEVDGNSGKIFLAEREDKQVVSETSKEETADLPF